MEGTAEAAFILGGDANRDKRFEEAIRLTTLAIDREPNHPGLAKCYGVRGTAQIWLGHYTEALADMAKCRDLRVGVYRDFSYAFSHAFIHSQRGEQDEAMKALAWKLFPEKLDNPRQALTDLLMTHLEPYLARYPKHQSVGVMIGNYGEAVGHSILDPFHFVQLHRDRFDNLLLVHPSLTSYNPAPMLSVRILEQYVDQVSTEDPVVLACAWHALGELKCENVTFLLNNYWSLNRAAALARMDETHALHQGRSYFQLPSRVVNRAAMGYDSNGIDITRPVVVVHIREHGYHQLTAQSFRNVEPKTYIPALRWLVQKGYTVVRIGDSKMTSLAQDVPGLIELPKLANYDPAMDLDLLSRCRFMISCQSGAMLTRPSLRRPNLILNAVYHYSLLPEGKELVAFKRYYDAETGITRPQAIFDRGAHLFDRTDHFDKFGIRLEGMTEQEVLAATQEMDAWMDQPGHEESEVQMQFREIAEWHAAHPPEDHPLWHPHADYIGYALPECRLAVSLGEFRPEYSQLQVENEPEPAEADATTRQQASVEAMA